MKRITLLAAVTAAVLFWAGCGGQQQTQQSPIVDANTGQMLQPDDDYWAKDNFDLQRVGDLVTRSHSPEEFERYLNQPRGINNLDLNGDGYVDYISVHEFDDLNDPYSRGLSMYTQYGPDLIQELGTVYFYRDEPQYPGARILLRGDPRIYGDNYYYETNWLDRSLQLVSFLFNGNRDIYSSPYYYDNYPTWYETYEVVEVPVYRTRVVELYPQPVVVYTTAPEIVNRIKIESPNDGRHFDQIKAKLVKPARAQEDFIQKNPRMVKVAKNGKGPKPNEERGAKPEGEKPGRPELRPNMESPGRRADADQPKAEAPRGERPKIARDNNRKERPAPMRPVTRPNNPAPARPANKAPGKPATAAPAKPAKPQGNPGKGQSKPGNPGGGNKGGGKGKKG